MRTRSTVHSDARSPRHSVHVWDSGNPVHSRLGVVHTSGHDRWSPQSTSPSKPYPRSRFLVSNTSEA
jgi:hypothetical protein